MLAKLSTISYIALTVSLLLGGARGWAQETPAVSLRQLRDSGVPGFESLPPRPAEIQTTRYGVLKSGWALPVEPGEIIAFKLADIPESVEPFWIPEKPESGEIRWIEKFDWSLPGGALSRSAEGRFRLRVPAGPGPARFTLTATSEVRQGAMELLGPGSLAFELTLLVKAPFDRSGNGTIGDYPIGIYPNELGRGASFFVQQHPDLYRPPESFLPVTAEIERLPLSEHFTVGDFSPRSERGRPHYIAVDPRLIEFLEAATESLTEFFPAGLAARPIRVVSAFLSPNRLRQLRTQGVRLVEFTRYQYGDAAAIIWDADGDGRMDDLDGDGTVTVEDASIFAQRLDGVQKALGKFGGIGVAASPKLPSLPDSPYVDVDMRGVRQRW